MIPSPIFEVMLADLFALHTHPLTYEISLPPSQDYTISFWFWIQSAKNKQVILYEGRSHTPNWELFIEDNHLYCDVQFNESRFRLINTPLVNINQWHHVTLLFRNDQLSAYLDGELILGESYSKLLPFNNHLTLSVGGYTDPAGGHYDYTFGRDGSGLLDDLCIYAPALSVADIQALYSSSDDIPDIRFTTTQHNASVVTFDATVLSSPNGKIRSFVWDYGDGHLGFGQRTEHQYDFGGNYVVNLLCIDDIHQQAIFSQQIRVDGKQSALELRPVFVNGEEGYQCYRIPAIVRATNGDLLAFAEARLETCSDATDTIHAVCKRSFDNGQTWQPLQIIAINPKRETISALQNISPVVDMIHGTGRIIVVYNANEYSEWDVTAGIGLIRTHVIFSDDNGATWHGETDITDQVHHPYQSTDSDNTDSKNRLHDWRMHRPTLGHGLQLTNGRLVFAGSITQGKLSVFQSQNVIFWSDDLGESWTIGGVIPRIGMNEAIAVELENGDLMINTRAYQDEKPLKRRAVTIGTFTDNNLIAFHETYLDDTLIDSAVQATIIRYTDSSQQVYGGKSRILFANPSHPHARRKMTVRLSYDDGQTWAVSKVIDSGLGAYSDLVIQADMQIGLLYERGNQGGIWYSNFTLDWLTDGQDSLTQTHRGTE